MHAWHLDCMWLAEDFWALATILIVDDEPDLVTNCQRLLRPLGHAVLSASTIDDAIRIMEEAAPDVVVTDLRLSGSDGMEVVRHARVRYPTVPVLVITADDSEAARRAARAVGVLDVLTKPFANVAFRESVTRLLDHSPRRSGEDPPGRDPSERG